MHMFPVLTFMVNNNNKHFDIPVHVDVGMAGRTLSIIVTIYSANFDCSSTSCGCVYKQCMLQVHVTLVDRLTYTCYSCVIHSLLYTGCTNIGYWPYV